MERGERFDTRDLVAFNRWLAVSRLRAVSGTAAITFLLAWLHPGLIAVRPVVGVMLWSMLLSGLGLLAGPETLGSRRYLALQTAGDLIAITIGVGLATSGPIALLLRWLFALAIVPVSLISAPVGLATALAATVAHGVLLVIERHDAAVLLGYEFLVPSILFFLVAQQCFFYAEHLARKNAALAALAEEVRTASALKSEFVGAVSHELRSPLNVILGYVEMALDGVLGPVTADMEDALRRTHRQSVGLLEMITSLLDLNRFEAGRVPVERTRVDVPVLLAELVEQVPDLWRRPGVSVRLACAPDVPCLVTDRGKLKTVLRNLFHNALKFTDAGEVVLGTWPGADGGIVIEVSDTGRGIPAESLGHVFEMFRQVPGPGGDGVGLGLHIVQRLVAALDGTVTVTSEIGRGSRFTLTLPASPVPAPGAEGCEATPPRRVRAA